MKSNNCANPFQRLGLFLRRTNEFDLLHVFKELALCGLEKFDGVG
jgi:hypothetical protein